MRFSPVSMITFLTSALMITLSTSAFASVGLVIHAAEIGVGKFHRYDNTVHAYANDNAWKAYVLAPSASIQTPVVQDNADRSVTIFFSNLEELLNTAVQLSDKAGQKISVLNINGHGLPGAMWFAKDAETQASDECRRWRKAASAEDRVNYDQYYSAVPKEEIMQIRQISDSTDFHMECTTGLNEWQEIGARVAGLKDHFAADAQIHFLSCVVGLGTAGDQFSQGIAKVLLSSSEGRVKTSMNFGLGDWSMPEGMGFWDYLNDTQLDHDNEVYPKNRSDREEMQKGTIRVASLTDSSTRSKLIADVDFMFLDQRNEKGTEVPDTLSFLPQEPSENATAALPAKIRIPGTTAYARLLK